MARLQGETALVTGGGSGIGRSIALLFAAEGARVAVLDVDAARAKAVCGEIEQQGGRALALVADVAKPNQLEHAFGQIAREFGGLRILVNNAGIAPRANFEKLSERDWDAVLGVNLRGAVTCTRLALPLLEAAHGGRVVNIASIEIAHHRRKLAPYATSKGALASLTSSLALELAPRGVRVNCICPGFIRTEMTRPYYSRWVFRKFIERRTPLGRLGEPEDVARVALFLASADSGFITGAAITVDGGLTLRAF